MRMSDEHYQTIKQAFGQLKQSSPTITPQYYRDNNKKPNQDIDKRFRWDALWAAKIDHPMARYGVASWVAHVLYPAGLNDTHIDTALRKAVVEVWG